MYPFPDIIFAIISAVSAFSAYLAHKKGDSAINEIANLTPQHSNEEIWQEILDIRATENKILEGMNKWLRKHGRTLQAESSVEAPVAKKRRSGMIIRNENV